jgi:hypothetical protein
MSKPMARSFRQAEDEAMLEVRRENGEMYDEMRKAEAKWNKENAEKWDAISIRYQIQMELIKKQHDALYQLEEATRGEMKTSQDKIYGQQWEALAPIREAQKERAEANKAKGQAIMEALIAKYAERVQAKQSA